MINEGQKFKEVFKSLRLSDENSTLLDSVYVKKIKILKSDKVIQLCLISDCIIYGEVMDEIKKQIQKKIANEFTVEIKLKFNIDCSNVKNTIILFWDSILYEIQKESPICLGILEKTKWKIENNQLVIDVLKNQIGFLEKRNYDVKIKELLFEQLNLELSVVFSERKIASNDKIKYEEEKIKVEKEMVEKVVESNAEYKQSADTQDANSTFNSSIILGKKIDGKIESIDSINEEMGDVVIVGEIMKLEAREIKSGKYILSFDITDHTNSLTIKSFIKKKKYEEEVSCRIQKGTVVKIKGSIQYDKYASENILMTRDISVSNIIFNDKQDTCKEKRVELHAHTQMSDMDSVANTEKLIERAAKWGHSAIAITDHGGVQAFPDAAKAGKKNNIKILYGVEAYIVDDLREVSKNSKNQTFEDTYVVFDIETTGLSNIADKIIEIGAVKIQKGEVVDTFSTFINPEMNIPDKIIELTNITNDMVSQAPVYETILPKFIEFCGEAVLVAHNASFDIGFIKRYALEIGSVINNTVLDTLELARVLFPDLTKHRLKTIAKLLKIKLVNHHRAVDDADATSKILLKCMNMLREKKINTLDELNEYAYKNVNLKALRANHGIILVKNYEGLKNLYKLVSMAHINYFFRRPRIPKSVLNKHRNGLIIGSACEAGELYQAILSNDTKERIEEIANYYDYFEIQPLGNNQFMIDKEIVNNEEDLININKKIVGLGEKYNKLVVGTCDVHFIDPEDEVYRRILMAAKKFKDADKQPPLYFRTTEEMIKEFSYLGQKKAEEIVIENTNKISEMIDIIKPIPDGTFPPSIEGADDEFTNITMTKAKDMYGENLPEIVAARLKRELDCIISNGYAVLYIIAQKLVWKSMEDGYLVGSRGSVGSSFAATMAGITEVNPLAPHYYCEKCKYSDFDSEIVKKFAGSSGCDMPDKKCPNCGEILIKDGHDIPFETFLGFDGDKEPDIDLNFSGEYQSKAHAYTEKLFGEGHVFKAGTIGTIAEKTAYGFVKKYLDEREITVSNAEINRLLQGCTGVKRTSGQHPGGQMVVPANNEIYEFCPVQRPANDVNSTITTTHFDYHSISGRLLKLDLLGHDDPTVIRMLEDLTKIDATKIPLDDKKTMSLFTSTEALGIKPEDINSQVGTLGLPEFGTKFVRQMLVDTEPKTFSDLIRISGLSHGTDVWLNNAQELVRNKTATLSQTISTRDDIMVYLILQGVEMKHAFFIMEKVRKGKGLTDEDEKAMVDAGVAKWYIDSCKKIKYMFPKAHAAAYVMMAFRIAYFKVYYPEKFYATFFSIRATDFDYALMCNGKEKVKKEIKELESKGNDITTKEKGTLTILEIVLEMYCRGIEFVPIDLYKSDSVKFKVTENGILPPLNSIQGLGSTAANNVVEARLNGEFLSIEEFRQRTKVSKTVIDVMIENKIIYGLPESNQLSLF